MQFGWEWVVILLVILLLFGAKRLPETARGLGRSLRILKSETRGLHEDDNVASPTGTRQDPAALPPVVTPIPPATTTPPAAPDVSTGSGSHTVVPDETSGR